MHIGTEDLRYLASGYVSRRRLDDRQISIKRHIACCDVCYEKFCGEYLIVKSLMPYLWMPERDEDSLHAACRVTMQLARQGMHRWKLSVEKGFLGEKRWEYVSMPHAVVARDGSEVDFFQSVLSAESHIRCEDGKVTVELDEAAYDGESLALLVIDGRRQEEYSFIYDEDTGLYVASADMGEYSEQAVVRIICLD